VSTPADLAKFIEAIYVHGLIKPRHLKMMQQVVGGYGLGIAQFTCGEHTGYGLPGSIDGFNSLLEYFPDDELAISYCSNGTITPVQDIVSGALKILWAEEK
jgi:hypothetical protein